MKIPTLPAILLTILLLCSAASAQQAGSSKIFGKPFAGEFPLGNWHDHNVPKEFIDTNGFIVNSNGRVTLYSIDGHEGYDWLMEEGTPLIAVADARVFFAGQGDPFICPILGNQSTITNFVTLEISINGELFYVVYVHLSEVLVTTGQQVKKGALLGLSGNTGCSTTPHLHFAVYRSRANASGTSLIDPYGWSGPGEDPWTLDPLGAESVDLWQEGGAPERFFDNFFAANNCSGCRAPVAITRVRWMGPDDDAAPNNEFVELTLDSRFGGRSRDIGGFTLRNNAGRRMKLPKRLVIRSSTPIKFFTGKGRNTKAQRFLGRNLSFWNDQGDCVHLFDRRGAFQYSFFLGDAECRFSPFFEKAGQRGQLLEAHGPEAAALLEKAFSSGRMCGGPPQP